MDCSTINNCFGISIQLVPKSSRQSAYVVPKSMASHISRLHFKAVMCDWRQFPIKELIYCMFRRIHNTQIWSCLLKIWAAIECLRATHLNLKKGPVSVANLLYIAYAPCFQRPIPHFYDLCPKSTNSDQDRTEKSRRCDPIKPKKVFTY